MTSHLDVLTRGTDSSGRPVKATRQHWQFYDRVNARVGGHLVIVQGGFMGGAGANASAGTHNLAGCLDFRTWNLTTAMRLEAERYGTSLGGSMWYRTEAQGFDPHIHNLLVGDRPMDPDALDQERQYLAGLNGLASRGRDDRPFLPNPRTAYRYLEDDMDETERRLLVETHARLERVEKVLDKFRTGEWKRDQEDRQRFSRLVDTLGSQADALTVLINSTDDDATKSELRAVKRAILKALRDNPDVDGKDNPAPQETP